MASFLLTSVTVLLLSTTPGGRGSSYHKISPQLSKSLTKQEYTANVFVTFSQGTESVLATISAKSFPSRSARLDQVHDSLVSHAASTQDDTIQLLAQEGHPYKSIWITNQLYVPDATMDLVIKLASSPDVAYVSQEEVIPLHQPVYRGPVRKRGKVRPSGEWGIMKIKANEARSLLKSLGQNVSIVVSSIDTGVRGTHEALSSNWRDDGYGWYDPYDKSALPRDKDGHGTHTMGTICGSGGIGVYPEAKWMACRGCKGGCTQFALLSCAQWIACPTMANGTKRDCSKAPHVVSNSWGGGGGRNWFDRAIGVWHAAKIIPLFSNGNEGTACNTTGSPADSKNNVISVGSTTVDDALSFFSSVGPTFDGRMKPDVSAPGSNVLSASHKGDSEYQPMSGTSMACPHTAGVAAILLAGSKQEMEYDRVLQLLADGADTKSLLSGGRGCVGVTDKVFPNHQFGHGRVNAFNSLTKLIKESE